MNKKQPVKLQLLCAGIHARLQPSHTPSARQIIGPNHCRSSGLSTCHMRLRVCKISGYQYSCACLPDCLCGRTSDAAVPQMQPRRSPQWAELPDRTDTPTVRLAASPAACNGVVAAPVCPSGSVTATPSRTIHRRGLEMVYLERFCNESIPYFPEFALRITVYSHRASKRSRSHERKSDSFVFVTLEQHRRGLLRSTVNLLFFVFFVFFGEIEKGRCCVFLFSPAWIAQEWRDADKEMFGGVRTGGETWAVMLCAVWLMCGSACLSDPADTTWTPQFRLSSFASNFICLRATSSRAARAAPQVQTGEFLHEDFKDCDGESSMVNNEYWTRTCRFQPLLLLLHACMHTIQAVGFNLDYWGFFFLSQLCCVIFHLPLPTGLNINGCRCGIFYPIGACYPALTQYYCDDQQKLNLLI